MHLQLDIYPDFVAVDRGCFLFVVRWITKNACDKYGATLDNNTVPCLILEGGLPHVKDPVTYLSILYQNLETYTSSRQ